jgi:hypothetical protein
MRLRISILFGLIILSVGVLKSPLGAHMLFNVTIWKAGFGFSLSAFD